MNIMRNIYKILAGKSEGKSPSGRVRRRSETIVLNAQNREQFLRV
jgi:hypothetical protein